MADDRQAGRATKAQKPSPEALDSLFDGVPFQMGISELTPDQDLVLVSVNPASAKALGRPLEEVQGRRISELGLAGPGKGVWLEQYLEALRTGRPVNFEQPGSLRGDDSWWEITLSPIGRGPSGQPRFAYIVRDVSDRKREERTREALYRISEAAQSEQTLTDLYARIHEIIGGLLPARNFFVAMYDEIGNELTFPYFVDEVDEPPGAYLLDDDTLSGRVIRLGRSLLFTPETPNEGDFREERIVGAPSLDWLGVPLKTRGRTIGALVVQSYDGDVRYTAQDQTLLEFVSGQVAAAIDRKQAEESVRASESRLEEAQRLAHLGSWHWDLHSGALTWSEELHRIYGVEPGRHRPSFEDFLRRVHPEDRDHVAGLVAQALSDRQPFRHETRIVRPDGEERVVFDRAEVLVDALGNATGMTGACLDITERKRAELLEQDRGQILEMVTQNAPLDAILKRVAETLEHQRPDLRACVLLLRNGRWVAGACPSFAHAFPDDLEAMGPTELGASFSAAAFSRAPAMVGDTASDAGWSRVSELCARHGIGSCWSVPILAASGVVLGTLGLLGGGPREPGAQDQQLLESMSRLVAVAIEHRQLTEELSFQAHHDALTGLPNRALFLDRLEQALALARRNHCQVAVLYMDVDRFKHVNDTLGHSSGDELLRQTAQRLRACLRGSDTLARLGGDEFTVVLGQLAGAEDAMRVARKMSDAMRTPFAVVGRELYVTLSLGISVFPDDGADAETLMSNADVAMYRAKELGRDNFQWFAAELNAVARERLELEGHLRQALPLGELSLAYQPQCGVDGAIQGFEALLRWNSPALGAVSPARFVPLAEDSGLIVAMGEWVLRHACAQAVQWRLLRPALRMAVNVSAVQFNRPDWVETVRRTLRETGLPPEALELEITESLLLQSAKETTANLFELRALGVSVAIDDFGTGYSSLSYLHKLPISTLKIDQSFVREIGLAPAHGQEEAPIIRTIIALAHNLGMSVVAEGVETEQQHRVLAALGCESLQGYFLHRPLAVDAASALLG